MLPQYLRRAMAKPLRVSALLTTEAAFAHLSAKSLITSRFAFKIEKIPNFVDRLTWYGKVWAYYWINYILFASFALFRSFAYLSHYLHVQLSTQLSTWSSTHQSTHQPIRFKTCFMQHVWTHVIRFMIYFMIYFIVCFIHAS